MTTASAKVVFLGPTGVGKTAIAIRFARDSFSRFSEPTIGASYLAKTVCYPSFSIRFNLWDTAGQERYDALTPMYYRGAQAAVLVFDLTSPGSFGEMTRWIQRLRCDHGPRLVYLLGNKCDLKEERRVTASTIEDFASKNQMEYFEVSALSGESISSVFEKIGSDIQSLETEQKRKAIQLGGENKVDDSSYFSSCC